MRRRLQIVFIGLLLIIGVLIAGMIGYQFARRKAPDRGIPGQMETYPPVSP